MLIAIVGGTGRTGRHVVEEALRAGHRVRMLARHPAHVAGVELVHGHALDPEALRQLVQGSDAVVCTLGPTPQGPPDVCSRATRLLVEAMKTAGVRRLVVQTGAMIGHRNLGRFYRFLASRPAIAAALPERREQERLVMESGLDWTLVRPPRLSDGAGAGAAQVGPDLRLGMMASVARVDLAHVLVRAATSRDWSGQGVTTVASFGGRRPGVALRAWLWRMGLAELLGIGASGAVAAGYLAAFGEPRTIATGFVFLGCMVAAGAFEGALLGLLPGRMLARAFPGLSVRRFAGFTLATAVGAWFLGMLPSTLQSGQPAVATPQVEPPLALVLGGTAVAGLFAGALMGGAQWLALKAVIPRAWRWVAASALGWALALPLDMLAGMLPEAGDPLWKTVLVSAGLGLSAGVLVALPTGWLLLRLLRERDAAPTPPGGLPRVAVA